MDEIELLGKFKLVLGLEIHLHLKTERKMFCGDDANIYNAEPNTHVCPVCLGLPGALPVPNFEAIQKTQLLGLALGCTMNKDSKFDRKHYFYPDLPKGYQISQYKQPFCLGGSVELDSGFNAALERIHLEEDVAKSFHEKNKTLIDFNKSGMPLVEIVTTPCFTNTADAVDFSKKIQDIVRSLGIGDVDMEKVKNINSFRFMERAVRAEIVRQREVWEKGEMPTQENRGYDEDQNLTVAQRSKEEAHDYRYFPEPDIPPMVFTDNYIEDLRKKLPELPARIKARLISKYGLSDQTAGILSGSENKEMYSKFEELVTLGVAAKKAGNALVNKKEFLKMPAKEISEHLQEGESKVTDTSVLNEAIDKVLAQNQDAVDNYKAGKITVIEFLVGQVMRETRGKADSNVVRNVLIGRLS